MHLNLFFFILNVCKTDTNKFAVKSGQWKKYFQKISFQLPVQFASIQSHCLNYLCESIKF